MRLILAEFLPPFKGLARRCDNRFVCGDRDPERLTGQLSNNCSETEANINGHYTMINRRLHTKSDQIIDVFDGFLRNFAGRRKYPNQQNYPAGPPQAEHMTSSERRHSAALMRVNHVGEVCAQALYAGQAIAASDSTVSRAMREAADEERDHLSWCEQRLEELGGRTSFLNPVWAAGSIGIGIVAGIAGDRKSLGFIEETEVQVCEHLDKHLETLPANDIRSRKIIKQMRADEARHASQARTMGAARLSGLTKAVMKLQARVMTSVAYRI